MGKWHRIVTAFTATGLTAAVAVGLAACGGGGASSSAGCTTPNGASVPGAQAAANTQLLAAAQGPIAARKAPSVGRPLVIATELPVVGTDASVGLPTQYGVDLAVSQNKDLGGGYTLSVQNENYAGANGPDTGIAT